jgi:hypothetical protein
LKQWLICILVSLSIVVVSEIRKAVVRRGRLQGTTSAVVTALPNPA